jgi:hypothetical protein
MSERPFRCPYCDFENEIPDSGFYITCSQCGHRLNLESQFAFLRSVDAFSEGQEILDGISPRKRRIPNSPTDRQSLDLFIEAYTAMQVAFKAELAELQRSLGVEMMANIADEFMKRNMVSPLEANYWISLLVEQNSQDEYDRLKEKIIQLRGPLAFLSRMRMRSRQKQLLNALAQLDGKLTALERQISFVDIPRTRNTKWKP